MKALNLLVDQGEAIVDGKILRDIVNDEVKPTLEDPRRSEEPWPSLNGVIEDLGFWTHEETRISSNLTEVRIAHLRFDDGVYEIQGERMVFHLHLIELVKGKLRNALDEDSEFAAKEVCLCFEVNLLFDWGGRKDIIANADIVVKNAF